MSKKVKKKNRKQKRQESELMIVSDTREPFTWRNFWDQQIIKRWKAFKRFLDEKGILFFIMSPFQYRNRLIAKLLIIFVCVMVGVVPRATTLINEAKERNASSELALITNKRFIQGEMVVYPLLSSNVDNHHVLTFLIQGDTASGVPSTANGYELFMSAVRGATDIENFKYKYGVIPMDANNRLLVVYTDQSKQNDTTGIYNLNVGIKGQAPLRYGMEIVLSQNQAQTDLFNGVMIDLSPLSSRLTEVVLGNRKGPIEQATRSLEDALHSYKLTEERLNASYIKVQPTYEELKAWTEKYAFLNGVSDTSTSAIVSVPIKDAPAITPPEVLVTTSTGEVYSDDVINQQQRISGRIKPNDVGHVEFPIVKQLVSNVNTQLNQLNQIRLSKYQQLFDWGRALNTPLLLEKLQDGNDVLKNPTFVPKVTPSE